MPSSFKNNKLKEMEWSSTMLVWEIMSQSHEQRDDTGLEVWPYLNKKWEE